MGLFDNFPYTNFHELNLMWILQALKEIQTTTEQFVAINSIKYADPFQWDITRQYEKNTLVMDPNSGDAYLSVQPVPIGVDIHNTDYWTLVFNYKTQFEDVLSQIAVNEENHTNATVAHAFNSLLIWNDKVYIALKDISVSDSFVEEYNVHQVTVYDFIRVMLNNLYNDITPSSEGNNAMYSRSYNVGDVLYWRDMLYIITTPVNYGDNILEGTNIERLSFISLIGNLNLLNTSNKGNLVNAINEVLANVISYTNAVGHRVDLAEEMITLHIEASGSTTATFNMVTGDWFILDDVLYEAQTNINIGDTYTIGTNIIKKSVEDFYRSILSMITDIRSHVNLENYAQILTVGNGCRFATINDAVNYGKNYCTPDNRVLILLSPKDYYENITLNPNPGIDIMGNGSRIIASVNYPYAPLFTVGRGYFADIWFVSYTTSPDLSYAVHVEAQGVNDIPTGFMIFENCYFESHTSHAFGAGLDGGLQLRLQNCFFYSDADEGFHVHNYPAGSTYISVDCKNCEFTGSTYDIGICDEAHKNGNNNTSIIALGFMNCITSKHKMYIETTDNVFYYNQLLASQVDSNIGWRVNGNNDIKGLNYDDCVIEYTVTAPIIENIDSPAETRIYLPTPVNMNQYDATVTGILGTSGSFDGYNLTVHNDYSLKLSFVNPSSMPAAFEISLKLTAK